MFPKLVSLSDGGDQQYIKRMGILKCEVST